MLRSNFAGSLLLALAISASIVSISRATDDADITIARVGAREFKASMLRKAMAGVPQFELRTLGTNEHDILRKYLDEAIVREELLAEAGRRAHAESDRYVQLQERKALAAAVIRQEIDALGTRESISDADVKAHYDEHVADYRTPERVRIWHLVVATEAEAKAALAKAKADPTREGWPKLVTEVSLDPNTKRSSGDLGFVTREGKSNDPKAVVPTEVATAAFALSDGDLASAPVKSGAGWHVVWRRGSLAASVRTMADEATTIRSALYEKKRQATYDALLVRLRAAAPSELHDDLLPLATVDVGPRAIPKTAASAKP